MNTLIQDFAIQLAVDLFIITYVGFFAIHAVQRVADPEERAGWLLMIVFMSIFGTTLYLLTKYRKFRAIGKGGWLVDRKWKGAPLKDYWAYYKRCFSLSEAEKLGL
jgi:hypothetical protein